ncbi:MAG: hypothetical protein ACRC62_08150, partial [Microcoleus sp.]
RSGDRGMILVEKNQIILPDGAQELLRYAVSPVSVPKMVWNCLTAVESAGVCLTIWYQVVEKAVELGYEESVEWIEANMEKYYDGLHRGFECEGKIIKTKDFVL